MARISPDSLMVTLFGLGKGFGAGLIIFILGLLGLVLCLVFRKILKKYNYQESV